MSQSLVGKGVPSLEANVVPRESVTFDLVAGLPPIPGIGDPDQFIGFDAKGFGFIMRWQDHEDQWACLGLQRKQDGKDWPLAFLVDPTNPLCPIAKHIAVPSWLLRAPVGDA